MRQETLSTGNSTKGRLRLAQGLFVLMLGAFVYGAATNRLAAQAKAPGEQRATAVSASPHFAEVTDASGIRFTGVASHTSHKYLIETMGSGVAAFDCDNDGRLDIFFANGAALDDPTPMGTVPHKRTAAEWDRLYRQRSDGTFEDITAASGLQGTGYDMGAAVGDFDNDGFEDLYVTAYGGNHLYRNDGHCHFTDVTKMSGTAGVPNAADSWSTSAAWVDLDQDGRLDLVVLRYTRWSFEDVWCGERKPGYRSYCHPDLFPAITPLVYHNNGDGTFKEVGRESGLNSPGKGLGIAIADVDGDGHIDIAIANDSMPEQLFHNRGHGTFEETGLTAEIAFDGNGRTYAGMGVDFQDYNNDGLPDLIFTNLAYQKYAIYQNQGEKGDVAFTYATDLSRLSPITGLHSGWGIRFLDYDNDGKKDLLVAQGHDLDNVALTNPEVQYREPMLLAHNVGNGKFIDVSSQAGPVFRETWVGRGLAIGDFNNDGRVEAVVTTNGGAAHLLRNETTTANHWLTLFLVGHTSNRDGIGAQIKLTTAAGSQWWSVSTAGSYLSSSDKRAYFGLGGESQVQEVEIRWPSGIRQVLHDVKADQVLAVDEPAPSSK